MSEELEDIVDNLREPSAWLRIAFMLIFALVLYLVIAPVILVLMLAQAIFTIVTGDDNDNLRKFGAALSQYIYQILQFLTFNSDEKPFPFSEFPGIALDEDIDDLGAGGETKKDSATAAPKKAAKKTAKKSTAKKAPRKRSTKSDDTDEGSADSPT